MEIDTLLPDFGREYYRDVHCFNRFTFAHGILVPRETDRPADVTGNDIGAASLIASKIFLVSNKFYAVCHFQIAMMFLSLRYRKWDDKAWAKIQRAFKGVLLLLHFLFVLFFVDTMIRCSNRGVMSVTLTELCNPISYVACDGLRVKAHT
jgi:hypothetical protein